MQVRQCTAEASIMTILNIAGCRFGGPYHSYIIYVRVQREACFPASVSPSVFHEDDDMMIQLCWLYSFKQEGNFSQWDEKAFDVSTGVGGGGAGGGGEAARGCRVSSDSVEI